ncbi:MAG: hypothetical protein ACKOSO_02885 [Actinomycetota bacterium]
MPYGWPFVVLVLLQALAVAVVRDPGELPPLRRHAALGLLPLALIGGLVVVLARWPAGVEYATALAAFAVPFLALVAGLHVRRWAIVLALAAPLLWLAAWRLSPGVGPELAADLLIVMAAAVLGRLTGWVAPRGALAAGVLIATGVDIWQVAQIQVQPVAEAQLLQGRQPPRRRDDGLGRRLHRRPGRRDRGRLPARHRRRGGRLRRRGAPARAPVRVGPVRAGDGRPGARAGPRRGGRAARRAGLGACGDRFARTP